MLHAAAERSLGRRGRHRRRASGVSDREPHGGIVVLECPEIGFEHRGSLGVITLDRQKSLNALTHTMVIAMGEQLHRWATDRAVGAVIIKAAEGRAFCAGGDVRAVVRTFQQAGLASAKQFFWDEYRLNWLIRNYPKPFIAFLDGVTMGGGVGISVHGAYRVGTENLVLAMPETAIGMFPDVGGTYLLTRPPKADASVGMFLALTGTRLGPADTLAFGYATHLVPAKGLQRLEDRLMRRSPEALASSGGSLGSVLEDELSGFDPLDGGAGEWDGRRDAIERTFGGSTLGAILAALTKATSGWELAQLKHLRSFSPLALHLTFEQLMRGRPLAFDDCLRMEYRLVQRVLERGDFSRRCPCHAHRQGSPTSLALPHDRGGAISGGRCVLCALAGR